MSAAFRIVFHNIADYKSTNRDLDQITDVLARSLSSNLGDKDELELRLTPVIQQLYINEVHPQVASLNAEMDIERPRKPVTDILELVLTNVLQMRETLGCVHGLRDRRRCWRSLVAACALAMEGSAFLSDYVQVIVPRSKLVTAIDPDTLERTAVALLSCWIQRRRPIGKLLTNTKGQMAESLSSGEDDEGPSIVLDTSTPDASSGNLIEASKLPEDGVSAATLEPRWETESDASEATTDPVLTLDLDRLTVQLILVKHKNPRLVIEQDINKMHHLYKNMTKFRYVESWDSMDSLPPCDRPLEEIRIKFFRRYEHLGSNAADQNVENLKLSDPLIAPIVERFSTFLSVAARAGFSRCASVDEFVVECCTKSAWDLAMRMGCTSDETAPIAGTLYAEQTLRLAASRVALEGTNVDAKDFAELNLNLAMAQVASTRADSELRPVAKEQLRRVLNRPITSPKVMDLQEIGHEPIHGTSDGVYCLRYNLVANSLSDDQQTASAKETEPCHCPQADVSSSTTNAPLRTSPNRERPILHIPVILNKYEQDAECLHQAFNQVRVFLVAAVEYLASLGVVDHPVWGVAAAGTEGAILMAWKSSASWDEEVERGDSDPQTRSQENSNGPMCNLIFDRNIQQFDLSDPLQAFHFLVCIQHIRAHQEQELRAKLEGHDDV